MAAVRQTEAPAVDQADPIPWSTVFAYGAPGVGAGYMFLLLSLYVMKFSTDVLLIAPAVMGVIFSASRVWDAAADPIVGYLSDRTKHPMGRRRIWMLASVIPTCATFVMLFSPPTSLGTFGLSIWMAIGVIGFYSAITLFAVPHLSLGAEMTTNYHERSRLFGLRHAAFTLGSILALASMQIFINAEAKGPEATRAAAEWISWLASGLMFGMVLFAVVKLRERAEFQGRKIGLPYQAFRGRLAQSARAPADHRDVHRKRRLGGDRRVDVVCRAVRRRSARTRAGDHPRVHDPIDVLGADVDSAVAALRQDPLVDFFDAADGCGVRRDVLTAVHCRGECRASG